MAQLPPSCTHRTYFYRLLHHALGHMFVSHVLIFSCVKVTPSCARRILRLKLRSRSVMTKMAVHAAPSPSLCILFLHQIEQCCSSLESRLQGVGEVQSHVRDVFSRLADLDDELDSLSPVGRDADSLASQADALKGFLSRLTTLRTELEGHASECTNMLRREGSSPDLLALRRETEALSRQAGKVRGMEYNQDDVMTTARLVLSNHNSYFSSPFSS